MGGENLDPAKQKDMINEADQLRNKAMQLQKSGTAQPGAKPAAGAKPAK